MLRWSAALVLVLWVSGLAAAEGGTALWLGRYHFVLLHLPIGLLAAIALLEGAALAAGQERPALGRGLLIWTNALATLATVVCGWLLAGDGSDYNATVLAWHRWGGIAVAVLAVGLVALHHGQVVRPNLAVPLRLVLVGGLALTALVGHHGGTLTHGSGFLTRHAPAWLGGPAPAVPQEPAPTATPVVATDDDTPADPPMGEGPSYEKDIRPILEARCIECHGPDKTKASLRLDTPAGIRSGGNSGPAIVAGHPERSSLVRFISLPAEDDDIMPPKGDPLTPAQIDLIRAWIKAGADFGDGVDTATTQPQAQEAARRSAFAEVADTLPVPNADALAKLQAAGVVIRPMDPSGKTLEVNASHAGIGPEVFDQLRRLAPNVLWLDLGGTTITDDDLKHLKPLIHLEKLDLGTTAVTDGGLIHLLELKQLRLLTLIRTQVSDAGLYRLGNLSKLEKVYLWGSRATAKGGASLTAKIPGCVVNTGP